MCSVLKIDTGVYMPGSMLQVHIGQKSFIGQWGLPRSGITAHNVRLENIDTIWSSVRQNRGYVVCDEFLDKDYFKAKEGRMAIAVVYDLQAHTALVTIEATGPVRDVHHRMPFILKTDEDRRMWVEEGSVQGYSQPELVKSNSK
jgi:putative SOS response-associated peptidase YedK